MQIFRLTLIALFFTLSLGACKKESDVTPKTRIVFWTKRVGIQADCYIDNKLVGTLTTATASAPLCGAPGSISVDVTPGAPSIAILQPNGDSVDGDVDAPEGQCCTVEVN